MSEHYSICRQFQDGGQFLWNFTHGMWGPMNYNRETVINSKEKAEQILSICNHDEVENNSGCKTFLQTPLIAFPLSGKEKPSVLQKQEGGTHYKGMIIEPAEYISKNKIGYLPGNAIKYLSRYEKKNGAEDIKKAIHYCEMILEFEYGQK